MTIVPEKRSDRLRVTGTQILTGPCAADVTHVQMSVVRFENGAVYRLADGVLTPFDENPFSHAELERAPDFPNGRFVDAAEYLIARRATGLERRYLGLWSDGRRWTVARFKVEPGRPASRPEPLFWSSAPVSGISFFPSPDSPAGSIWLVQHPPGRQSQLVLLHWTHEFGTEP